MAATDLTIPSIAARGDEGARLVIGEIVENQVARGDEDLLAIWERNAPAATLAAKDLAEPPLMLWDEQPGEGAGRGPTTSRVPSPTRIRCAVDVRLLGPRVQPGGGTRSGELST